MKRGFIDSTLEDQSERVEAGSSDSEQRTAIPKGEDTYANFGELRRNEIEGIDYRIVSIPGASGIAVMAPHGGNIEPGTSEIARAISSGEHTFYGFEGLKPTGNRKLHITSTRFDEPLCVATLGRSKTAVILHGCKGKEEKVYIGGLDDDFKSVLEERLLRAGFAVGARPGLQGKSAQNLCNGCPGGMGVQLELTTGLRRLMFGDLTQDGRRTTTTIFSSFVTAVRQAISIFAGSHLPEAARAGGAEYPSTQGRLMEC
jgi:phage replication-related protein YjqB (UPF0714/DUF867 family)